MLVFALLPFLLVVRAAGESAAGESGLLPAKLRISEPAEGSSTGLSFNVVMSIDTEDGDEFQQQYKDSYACLDFDDASGYMCFPIFGMTVMPRFVQVSEAEHRVRAFLTDPVTGKLLAESSSGTRSFFAAAPAPAPAIAPPEPIETPAQPPPQPPAEEQVQVDTPVVQLAAPAEMDTLPTEFDVIPTVTSQQPDIFERHFRNEFVCMSLDGGSFCCYPIFTMARLPRLMAVTEGMHTLIAKITHPDSGKLIEQSSSGVRRFVAGEEYAEEYNEEL
jgi:hypothetical protein